MKFLFPLFCFLAFSPLFGAINQNEIGAIEELIAITQKNLLSQKQLLNSLIEFELAKKAFIDDPVSGKLATSLVKIALRVNEQIERENLIYLFSPEFLTEIQFFSQVAKQRAIHE